MSPSVQRRELDGTDRRTADLCLAGLATHSSFWDSHKHQAMQEKSKAGTQTTWFHLYEIKNQVR